MSITSVETARAVADVAIGEILATVEIAAAPERVFAALASEQILLWWVRPGVFDTREWDAEFRVGGAWRAAGVGRGRPYVLEGELTHIDPPHGLAHTWRAAQEPAVTSVTYRLDPIPSGTRITLRHTGFTVAAVCVATQLGWETSFDRLAELFSQ